MGMGDKSRCRNFTWALGIVNINMTIINTPMTIVPPLHPACQVDKKSKKKKKKSNKKIIPPLHPACQVDKKK